MATCPECDAEIEIDDEDLEEMEIGDPWDCDACGSRLLIANLDPLDFESDDDEDEEDEEKEEEAETDEIIDDEVDDDDETDEGEWEE